MAVWLAEMREKGDPGDVARRGQVIACLAMVRQLHRCCYNEPSIRSPYVKRSRKSLTPKITELRCEVLEGRILFKNEGKPSRRRNRNVAESSPNLRF